MAYKLEFHPEAEAELDEAFAWYLQESPGLEQDFFEEYLTLENRIEQNPREFPLVVEDIRRANFHRFPYSIFFSIEGQTAFVHAIFHQNVILKFGKCEPGKTNPAQARHEVSGLDD
ncbi:MAG: type II toxin-antitoxin system RelE/ParE family toxin [Saprospiraceae bacterium]|nr:type II toxin-antitoxin system RelE/ParE family toxin [Saprospiraceae bacterium]